jgi:hypothetical protein
VLTIAGGGTLPVFNFGEEAEMFLYLETQGAGWEAGRFTIGQLVSVLCGPLAGVRKVALDPLPEVCGRALVGLVSLDQHDFVRVLLDERGPSTTSAVGVGV